MNKSGGTTIKFLLKRWLKDQGYKVGQFDTEGKQLVFSSPSMNRGFEGDTEALPLCLRTIPAAHEPVPSLAPDSLCSLCVSYLAIFPYERFWFSVTTMAQTVHHQAAPAWRRFS